MLNEPVHKKIASSDTLSKELIMMMNRGGSRDNYKKYNKKRTYCKDIKGILVGSCTSKH